MSFPKHPAGRRAVRCAALACLLLAAAPPARPAPRAWPPPAGRSLQYLEMGLGQLQRLERRIKRLGEDRQGAGALAAAALAAAGRPTGADAARWTTTVLDACAGRWQRFQCQHAEMALQRIALQYPQALPPPLLGRVRAQAVAAAPSPGPEAVNDPWRFKDTENQRMLQIARSLGAQTLAGTPDSPVARGWGAYAEAFLAAHDRQGWYEAESPGYLASSITSLLHLADHAPQPAVRELAVRQLNLLFARWAQEQVGGFPAGAKSRTYVHWALGHRNTAWRAWAWLAGALPSAEGLSFMDWPELPASGYALPAPVAELLAERHKQAPYEVKARRRIDLGERMDLDVALYSYATPDYVLGTAQAVGGLRLSVSGGQEILATLFPECGFAPLYLWSRSDNPRQDRWRNWGREDLAVGHENTALARLGGPGAIGHAYFAPGWSPPEPRAGDGAVVFSRCGDAYVALVTAGGWEVASAPQRLPGYYGGDKAYRDAWVAVPRVQPARVALEAGRRAEDGPFERFHARLAGTRLGEVDGELRYRTAAGLALAFRPGERATAGGRAIDAHAYAPLEGPFLSRPREGGWRFAWKAVRLNLPELAPKGRAEPGRG
ncbi:MAG TPA: hypothetical protein VGC93_00695 [Thermoanaerobaculia bacterium]